MVSFVINYVKLDQHTKQPTFVRSIFFVVEMCLTHVASALAFFSLDLAQSREMDL